MRSEAGLGLEAVVDLEEGRYQRERVMVPFGRLSG
jgi:hypothetical protein